MKIHVNAALAQEKRGDLTDQDPPSLTRVLPHATEKLWSMAVLADDTGLSRSEVIPQTASTAHSVQMLPAALFQA